MGDSLVDKSCFFNQTISDAFFFMLTCLYFRFLDYLTVTNIGSVSGTGLTYNTSILISIHLLQLDVIASLLYDVWFDNCS